MDVQTSIINESTTNKHSVSYERRGIARKRWELLINVLANKRNKIDSSISVRRFASFGLLKTDVLSSDCEENVNTVTGQKYTRRHIWYRYTNSDHQFTAQIRHLDGVIDISDVLGFNNTGNVCVWPSEEVLAHYCLQNKDLFRDKQVCELGGGMTCLAGLVVAQCSKASRILLTDGNQASVDNVNLVIDRNKETFGNAVVSASLLRWNEVAKDLKDMFDVIISADCLFFDEYREDLVDALHKLLKPEGQVIIFAPSRGDTFRQFVSLLDDRFCDVTCQEKHDDHIWQLHQQNLQKGQESYDPNLHYPMLLTFRKVGQNHSIR